MVRLQIRVPTGLSELREPQQWRIHEPIGSRRQAANLIRLEVLPNVLWPFDWRTDWQC